MGPIKHLSPDYTSKKRSTIRTGLKIKLSLVRSECDLPKPVKTEVKAEETVVPDAPKPDLAVKIKQEEDDDAVIAPANPPAKSYTRPPPPLMTLATFAAAQSLVALAQASSYVGGPAPSDPSTSSGPRRQSERIRQKVSARARKPKKFFVCTGSGCGHKKFERSQHLARHLRTSKHYNEKPFQCTRCTFASSRADNMKAHILNSHDSDGKAVEEHLAQANVQRGDLNVTFDATLRLMSTAVSGRLEEWWTSELFRPIG